MTKAIEDLFVYLVENWRDLSVKALLTAIAVIVLRRFLIKHMMRLLHQYLPQYFKNDQDEINHKLDLIIHHLGVEGEWGAGETNCEVSTARQNLQYGWVTRFHARRVALFIRLQGIGKLILRRKKKMNKWIKPDKLTVMGGVIVTAANEYFGWSLDPANLAGFFFILFTYFKQHEILKVVRYSYGLPVKFKVNSTKLVFTVVGLIVTVMDMVYVMGIGQETILMVATFISGYNAYEGNEDVKKSEQEGRDAERAH
jgi:hypothetical protein